MSTAPAFDRVVQLAYGAALDPGHWSTFLKETSCLLDADGAQIIVASRDYSRVRLSEVWGYPESARDEYVAYYHQIDPRAQLVLRRPPGEVVQDHLYIDEHVVRHSEYYNDYLARYDARHVSAGRLDCGNDTAVLYAVLSSARRGPLTADKVGLLARIHAHLRCAAGLQERWGNTWSARTGFESLVAALDDPVLILSESGHLLLCNAAAESLLKVGEGLCVSRGRIAARTPDENAKLRQLLCAVHGSAERALAYSPYLCLTRRPPLEPLRAAVIPLAPPVFGTETGRIMLWIDLPAEIPRMPAEAFACWYKLTRAEVRLALLLLSNRTLKEAADTMGIALTTAKSQLQSLFAKTGTRRQSELMVKLARAVPSVKQRIDPAALQ